MQPEQDRFRGMTFEVTTFRDPMDDRSIAEGGLRPQPEATARARRYRDLQRLHRDQMDFDASGLRRVVSEIQSRTGTLTERNGQFTPRDRLVLLALRFRWWLAGFLLLRDGLAEATYSSHRALLDREERLQNALGELSEEVKTLRSEVTALREQLGSAPRR